MSQINFSKLSGYRILIFCWSNPNLEEYYVNFINEVSNNVEVLPIFIVTTVLSKLRFLKRDMYAFTYQELIRYNLQFGNSADDKYCGFNRKILKDLSDYDRSVGSKWIPNPNLTEKEFYVHQSLMILKGYNFIWQNFKPHLAITWNGVTLFQKALAFLAHNYDVPVLFFERGLLPQTLYVDTEGVNYKSSIAGDKWFKYKIPYPHDDKIKKVKKYCQKLRKDKRSIVNIGESTQPEELRKRLKIDDKSKIVLIPLQIEKDSNILYFSPYYSNMPEIIKDIQRAINQFNNIHLIVKPHPEDSNRLNELRSLTTNTTHILDDVKLYSLLELADLVITVNSTVGLEALVFRKPVIVLGKAMYSEKGFTYDLLDRRVLPKLIEVAFKKHTFNEKEFYRFLVHLLENKLFSLDTDQDSWNSRKSIVNNLVAIMKEQNPENVTITTKLIDKLYENFRLRKIFDKKNILILGSLDEGLETILHEPQKKITKLFNIKETLRQLNKILTIKNRPDLVITSSPLSLKRFILFKFIRSDMKVLLSANHFKILFSTGFNNQKAK